MKKRLLLIVFTGGLLVFALNCGCSDQASTLPVETSFCNLIHYRERYANQRFLTKAHLVLDIHGAMLLDPTCSDGVLTFTSTSGADGDGLNGLLKKGLSSHGYADVMVKFTGTLNSPSQIERASIWFKRKFGIQTSREKDVTIDKIISAEETVPPSEGAAPKTSTSQK